MAVRIIRTFDAPTTSYPEHERILELRFHHDEGTNPPTYAIVDLDMDKNIPEDLEEEIGWQLRIHMGKSVARRYEGYEDVTDYLIESAHTYGDINDLMFDIKQTLGEYASDYDVEGIANEISDWKDGHLVADIEREDYWDIVRRHEN